MFLLYLINTYLFVLLRLLPQTKSGDFAKRILRLIPSERLSAEDALAHEYFASLPPALFTLPDSKWLFEYILYNSYFISLSLSPLPLQKPLFSCYPAFCSTDSTLLYQPFKSL